MPGIRDRRTRPAPRGRLHAQGGVKAQVGVVALPVEFRCHDIAHRQRRRARFGDVDDAVRVLARASSTIHTATPSARRNRPVSPGLAAAARVEYRAVQFEAALGHRDPAGGAERPIRVVAK